MNLSPPKDLNFKLQQIDVVCCGTFGVTRSAEKSPRYVNRVQASA